MLLLLAVGIAVGYFLLHDAGSSVSSVREISLPVPVSVSEHLQLAKIPVTEITTTQDTVCRLEHAASRPVGQRMRSAVQTYPMQGWMSWAE